MSKICIANCVKDARIPVRATYVNLYKWPESDAEFMRSAAAHGGARPRTNSISCRQIYLSSYKFSRKESVPERTVRCFGKVRDRVAAEMPRRRRRRRKRRCILARRVKEFTRAALFAVFRRLLFCTSTVDVADNNGVN